MKVGNVGNVKTQLCQKDGCSFYTYSLQILDQVIRLISQLPAVLVLQTLVLDKFQVVLQLSTWSRTHPTLDCQLNIGQLRSAPHLSTDISCSMAK